MSMEMLGVPEFDGLTYFTLDLPGYPRLPGITWETGNMFDGTIEQALPQLDMHEGIFDDKLWCQQPEQRLFLEQLHPVLQHIFYSDPFRRLQAIEQLTLPPEYSIVPNTSAFSRAESLLGGVLWLEQMGTKLDLSREEITKLQLICMFSDLAHTVGSHKGDHMFQGVGGPENLHDLDLMSYCLATGLVDILEKFGFDPEEIINPQGFNIAQAKRPDICVDNIDYVLREANRSNDAIRQMKFSSDDFTVTPDGIAAFIDLQRARAFAEADMLLSQLNWGSPVHRVIEHLLMVRSKLFYVEGGGPDMWVFHEDHPGFMLFDDVHPRDLMYVTDPVERAGFSLPSAGGDLIHKIMAQIATYQRQFVWPIRRQRQYRYMQQFTDPAGYQEVLEHGHLAFDNPAFDHNYTDDPGSSPGLLEILDIDEARRTASDEYVDLLMDTPFKVRQTDPLIQVGDTMFRRLSELDPSYSRRKAEHAATVTKQYVARLHLEPEDRDLLKDTLAKIDQKWEAHLQQTRRLKPSELKALVRNSASHIHGRYSFMMFEPF